MLGEASYTVKVSKEFPADGAGGNRPYGCSRVRVELLRDDEGAAKQIENRACGFSS